MRITLWLGVLGLIAVAVGGYAIARHTQQHRDSLGTLVLDGAVTDRAHLRRVEMGPGDTLDRLGVEAYDDQQSSELAPLEDGERRFAFLTVGCPLTDPVLVLDGDRLRADWYQEPGVSCSPEPTNLAVFDVDADVVPPGTDLASVTMGTLTGWHRVPFDRAHGVPGELTVDQRGGEDARVRAVVAGCQEQDPPYLTSVGGRLDVAFPVLGPQLDCEQHYVATFEVPKTLLSSATGPARPVM